MKKEKRKTPESKPCVVCGELCDSKKEVVGMKLSTGEMWHVRCRNEEQVER
jgi:hypothetical protein